MVATDRMLPAMHAGFINGVSAHSVEMDDAHHGALAKAGSVIIPASMAMGEATAADGKKFIAAIVAGYETMIRIGLAPPTAGGRFTPRPPAAVGFRPAARG